MSENVTSFNIPRILLAATSSGSGKTLITCGLLKALTNRNKKVCSFKCGPDYIDPMFHSSIIGTKSSNLDTFFTDENTTRYLFANHSKNMDISVMEGVMGYYDGLAGISSKASSYDISRVTITPTILIVDCKGMSLSILPLIEGFLKYQEPRLIKGVILNKISPMLYPDMKQLIESQLDVVVLGYVPVLDNLIIESRHLGLITPEEVDGLKEKVAQLALQMEKTLDMENILKLAALAPPLTYSPITLPSIHLRNMHNEAISPVIAVARDSAFCFYYEDNLNLLRKLGATIRFFSPLKDKALPPNIHGLILGGGYPELYAKELSLNQSMKGSIHNHVEKGIPCLAECGGFMYLHTQMEDTKGDFYDMVNLIEGTSFRTPKLSRFGYITLEALSDSYLCAEGDIIHGHEFHYWDSTSCGSMFIAKKPLRKRTWNCIHNYKNLLAGYPHLYYYSNISMLVNFLETCCKTAS